MNVNLLDELNDRLSSLCGMIMNGGVSRACDKATANYGINYVLCEYGQAVDEFGNTYMMGETVTVEILKNLLNRFAAFADKYDLEEEIAGPIMNLIAELLFEDTNSR